ncbi:SqhC [Bacillus sp. NRRL B-14911]|nr:SqhC [Bacillus sp. NRRL B-14911]
MKNRNKGAGCMQLVKSEIERLKQQLLSEQTPDGSWNHPFDTGCMTDIYMIVLLRTLEEEDEEELIKELAKGILSRQGKDGAWRLFHDHHEGSLSLTIEAYYALLYSGYYEKNHPALVKARRVITKGGGLKKAGMYTKIMLALTGQYPWPLLFPVPMEVILLPRSFPLNMYDISVFGRSNLIPVILLGNKKFSRKTALSPDLGDLSVRDDDDPWPELRSAEWRSLTSFLAAGVKALVGIPRQIRAWSIEKAREYMQSHTEPDGTLYNYFSSTFYMIFALLALGGGPEEPAIRNAVAGLKRMTVKADGRTHIQYTTAAVWNTALISHALQEAGVPPKENAIQKANQYLAGQQHRRFGDWIVHNTKAEPGGWGFSRFNTINPDVDDTTAALRSLYQPAREKPHYDDIWKKGLLWTLSMQNRDGGWPAFERNVDKKLLHLLPIQGAEFILTDPSTADLTGRTLEFLGKAGYADASLPPIKKAVKWLKKHQEPNGSWYGRWGICYIYGTWAAVTGMAAVGVTLEDKSMKKGIDWLLSIQNEDGGWGESCRSDMEKKYIPLKESTLTQTAWAVDALAAAGMADSTPSRKGAAFLVREGKRKDWTADYPMGQGMANFFYIHYHSYRCIWPLLALSHYIEKSEAPD